MELLATAVYQACNYLEPGIQAYRRNNESERGHQVAQMASGGRFVRPFGLDF